MRDIVWTKTDESPFVASASLLPILKSFLSKVDINLKVADISLCGRILSAFGYANDDLKMISELTKQNGTNIIKLPNISATIPQLKSAIDELKKAGFDIPSYPENIQSKDDERVAKIYSSVLGSAVNPALRNGNSQRYSTKAVKDYARSNPHYMGEWSSDVKTEICSMKGGDFYQNELSFISFCDDDLSIKFISENGEVLNLKDDIKIQKGDLVDASFMSVKELYKFYKEQIDDAKQKDLLFSLHLKCSMMKVSDPVIFGYAIRAFFEPIFDEFEVEFKRHEIKAENGLSDIFSKIDKLDENLKDKIYKRFDECFKNRPDIAMVDCKNGITNIHTPNGVIIDASMPVMLRNSGKMYDKNGNLKETKAIIPDKTYAGVYQAVLQDFKTNGKLDVSNLGSVINIGLMAKKAQEYGSHDKSFVASDNGEFVVSSKGSEIFKFKVQSGDIFRMSTTKAEAIQNWIDLAIDKFKTSGLRSIFWLDENRLSDKNIISIVKDKIKGLNIEILNPKDACLATLETIRNGKDCINITGNVLRDYLTDLFPIFELGTSAKMLSIVPLLSGGALFETGAGGTAPLLTKELLEQNHIIWDSLGEFLALTASLEFYAKNNNDKNAQILSKALDKAVSSYLKDSRSPSLQVGQNDTRASHFYLALYWANELKNSELGFKFKDMADSLSKNEKEIVDELNSAQGRSIELGGWYFMDQNVLDKVMRPSKILNEIIG